MDRNNKNHRLNISTHKRLLEILVVHRDPVYTYILLFTYYGTKITAHDVSKLGLRTVVKDVIGYIEDMPRKQ